MMVTPLNALTYTLCIRALDKLNLTWWFNVRLMLIFTAATGAPNKGPEVTKNNSDRFYKDEV